MHVSMLMCFCLVEEIRSVSNEWLQQLCLCLFLSILYLSLNPKLQIYEACALASEVFEWKMYIEFFYGDPEFGLLDFYLLF